MGGPAGELTSPLGFKAGFVAILGRPSAGKSTLLNKLLGSKLSIVSPLPQTTRHKILGILNGPGFQLCFLDTPGLLDQPYDKLQDALTRTARITGREDADINLLLVGPFKPNDADKQSLAQVCVRKPTVLVVNKADLVKPEQAKEAAEAWRAAVNPVDAHVVSALRGDGVDALKAALAARLPESPAYYPADQLSDRWERFFATEIVREKLFDVYKQEIPHACAVELIDFVEAPPAKARIDMRIYCERDSQKGILVGKDGRSIRALREAAQSAIQDFLGRPIELELRVKVWKGWRQDADALKRLGYIPS